MKSIATISAVFVFVFSVLLFLVGCVSHQKQLPAISPAIITVPPVTVKKVEPVKPAPTPVRKTPKVEQSHLYNLPAPESANPMPTVAPKPSVTPKLAPGIIDLDQTPEQREPELPTPSKYMTYRPSPRGGTFFPKYV